MIVDFLIAIERGGSGIKGFYRIVQRALDSLCLCFILGISELVMRDRLVLQKDPLHDSDESGSAPHTSRSRHSHTPQVNTPLSFSNLPIESKTQIWCTSCDNCLEDLQGQPCHGDKKMDGAVMKYGVVIFAVPSREDPYVSVCFISINPHGMSSK